MLLNHCFHESEALSVVELQESADRSFATEQTKGFVQGLPLEQPGNPLCGGLLNVSQHKQGKSQALVKVYIFAISLEVDVRENKEAVKRH